MMKKASIFLAIMVSFLAVSVMAEKSAVSGTKGQSVVKQTEMAKGEGEAKISQEKQKKYNALEKLDDKAIKQMEESAKEASTVK